MRVSVRINEGLPGAGTCLPPTCHLTMDAQQKEHVGRSLSTREDAVVVNNVNLRSIRVTQREHETVTLRCLSAAALIRICRSIPNYTSCHYPIKKTDRTLACNESVLLQETHAGSWQLITHPTKEKEDTVSPLSGERMPSAPGVNSWITVLQSGTYRKSSATTAANNSYLQWRMWMKTTVRLISYFQMAVFHSQKCRCWCQISGQLRYRKLLKDETQSPREPFMRCARGLIESSTRANPEIQTFCKSFWWITALLTANYHIYQTIWFIHVVIYDCSVLSFVCVESFYMQFMLIPE